MPRPELPDWVLRSLACPSDGTPLSSVVTGLECAAGHRFRIRDGIPILLRDDVEQTHEAALHALRGDDDERYAVPPAGTVDHYVQEAIGATGGFMYAGLRGHLTEYPIPSLRLPPGDGRMLIEVGCNWGRWSIAAAQRGYRVLGIDPSFTAIQAARRVARQLEIDAAYLVADARFLPCAPHSFDAAFSYSVLQHLSKPDASRAFREIGRVLRSGGRSLVQMPNTWGMRSLYHQARRRFRDPKLFEVRYWTVGELRRMAVEAIGRTTITVDGFFSLNVQAADLAVLPARYRAVVRMSEALRAAAARVPMLVHAADSLYVDSQRDATNRA